MPAIRRVSIPLLVATSLTFLLFYARDYHLEDDRRVRFLVRAQANDYEEWKLRIVKEPLHKLVVPTNIRPSNVRDVTASSYTTVSDTTSRKETAVHQNVSAPHLIANSMIEPCEEAQGDEICERYLSKVDRESYDRCEAVQLAGRYRSASPGACRFMDGNGKRGPVALVSFPGSGNTWVRGLLEKATGICTGEIACVFTPYQFVH